jgi:ribonucleotide monophosphatase NagD (HAD superfamily)
VLEVRIKAAESTIEALRIENTNMKTITNSAGDSQREFVQQAQQKCSDLELKLRQAKE